MTKLIGIIRDTKTNYDVHNLNPLGIFESLHEETIANYCHLLEEPN